MEAESDRPGAATPHAAARHRGNDVPCDDPLRSASTLLSSRLPSYHGVKRWVADQQGAVAIIVGLASIGLLGVGAVVVDVGMLYAEKAELQNGADAAALAVAEGCAADACGDMWAVAQRLAEANASDGAAQVDDVALVSQRVVVTVSSATAAGGSAVRHRLAPLLGFDETTVTATAAADWGGPIGGTAVVPLAISWCSFEAHTGGGVPSSDIEQTITYLADDG
ncbi:MAG: pilus assembly protein TadG-related protein, partial [Nitriliruptoraceae bacterium]